MTTSFIPGLELNEAFYRDAVRPLLAAHFPSLRHSAALIGYGSDVLGFDTPRSTDHEWGPRLLLFLDETDHAALATPVDQALRDHLPHSFGGYATNFSATTPVQRMQPSASGPVNHKVWIQTPRAFIRHTLDFELDQDIRTLDWLTFPEQRLLEITSGRVFHDGLGALEPLRARFRDYPRDVWFYLLAAQWKSIAHEEAFVGRTGEVGDELGSRLIAARQVQRLMKLGFLMERQYAPYSKWFGTAFARLACAPELGPILETITAASSWQARDEHLAQAYTVVAHLHNQLDITPPLDATITDYYDRPFRVIFAERFAEALRHAIQDEEIRRLPQDIGAVDQWATSVDILVEAKLCRKLQAVYT